MPSVGIVGGRGYVGEELLQHLSRHPQFTVACVASQSLAGQPVGETIADATNLPPLFVAPTVDEFRRTSIDCWILAQGNGEAAAVVSQLESSIHAPKIIDISADFRCDAGWQYGLADVLGASIRHAAHVTNPGCYATGVQLALWPIRQWLRGTPVAFGVSGYSGAGRTPSARNDPQRLAGNLMPYHLRGHPHEREIAYHLDRPVRLLPHVAEFLRGISLTIWVELDPHISLPELQQAYRQFYAASRTVGFDDEVPEIASVRQTPQCRIGGLAPDPISNTRWTLVSVLDNLAKGAATQAIQNLNLMHGFDCELGLVND